MAKKGKRNTGLYIIIYILLIIATSASIATYFYYDKKIKEVDDIHSNEKEIYKEKKEVLENKNKELETKIEELSSYDDLDKKVTELKNNYYKKLKELEDGILNGTIDKKIAYLTFDDGPYYSTHKVFEILEKYDVRATFFTTNINGEYCFDNKNENCHVLYKEYLKRGHTLANHTYTHGIGRGLYSSADSFMDAVIKQEELIKEQTGGYVTNIIRFPGGSRTAGKLKEPIAEKLRARGYGYADWTTEDGDGGDLRSQEQAWSNIKSTLSKKVEVILLHDYNKITISILPDLITYLREKGYILLPLFYESSMVKK